MDVIQSATLLAQAQPDGGAGLVGMLLPLGIIFIIFYFILWRPQAKQAQKHRQFLDALKAGDEVVTAGGVFGTVRALDEKTVTLEISKGTKITILKSQIKASKEAYLGGDNATKDEKSSEK